MDCAVIPLQRHKDYSLVQTVDFFYPLVDNPHVMGKIALANVVSDVCAVGVTQLDKLQMLITSPTEFSEHERDTIVPMIIAGFREAAKSADCTVHIRSISINPWCIIGGIATTLCKQEEIIMPSNAQVGDAIVLTKPLGTFLATNAYIWMKENNEKYQQLQEHFSNEDIMETFNLCIKSMCYLNKNAALLMHTYKAHAATDVTGFGLLGHAQNLAEFQNKRVQFEINKLPIMKNVLKFAEILNMTTKLKAGKAVETSGGLLICLPAENATAFCAEFKQITNDEQKAWIVGEVKAAAEEQNRAAYLAENLEYIEVNL